MIHKEITHGKVETILGVVLPTVWVDHCLAGRGDYVDCFLTSTQDLLDRKYWLLDKGCVAGEVENEEQAC